MRCLVQLDRFLRGAIWSERHGGFPKSAEAFHREPSGLLDRVLPPPDQRQVYTCRLLCSWFIFVCFVYGLFLYAVVVVVVIGVLFLLLVVDVAVVVVVCLTLAHCHNLARRHGTKRLQLGRNTNQTKRGRGPETICGGGGGGFGE